MKVVLILELLYISLTIAIPRKNGLALNRQAPTGPTTLGPPTYTWVNYTEGEKLLWSCSYPRCKQDCNRQSISKLADKLYDAFKTCNLDLNTPMGRKGKKGKKSKKGKCKKGKCKSKGGKGGKRCISANKLMEKIAARAKSKW